MRYTATIQLYVHAKSDKGAIARIKAICVELDKKHDNKATLHSLVGQPYGSLESREVEIK